MTSSRTITTLALTLASACIVTKPIGDADTEGSPSTGADPTNTDPSVGESTGDAIETDGDPDPRYVDCAAQDWGPEVGGGELTALGFPDKACNPRTSGAAFGYQCCSDDPATADAQLPAYEMKGIAGSAPLYADAANGAGTSGMCVRTTEIPYGSGLLSDEATNCPIPCDPTWADGGVDSVCGSGRVCCQTRELGPKDCVQQDGVWRPVHGDDISNGQVVPATNWNNAAHDTHQDPNGTVCLAESGADSSSEEFLECIGSLSVADRRGFCMALGPGQACPGTAASYVDACEAKN